MVQCLAFTRTVVVKYLPTEDHNPNMKLLPSSKQTWSTSSMKFLWGSLIPNNHANPELYSKVRGVFIGSLEDDIFLALTALISGHSHGKSKKFPIGQEVYFQNQHVRHSVQYTNFHTSHHHSLIYYHHDESNFSVNLAPAQICAIFQHTHLGNKSQLLTEVFFAIHEYRPSTSIKNPFAPFPEFHVGIYNQEPSATVQVIPAAQVHCQANQQLWDGESVVMCPIDRVIPS